MASLPSRSRLHWPKRLVLDYSKDEYVRITVGIAPNIDTFKISKIRLAYYSPDFHTSLRFPREDTKVLALPYICPKIFRHIVQYVNTETIFFPDPDTDKAIIRQKHVTATSTPPYLYLDLPTLARIWFLPHYLLIPHIQNIAIYHMFYRITKCSLEHDFDIDEMTIAISIASGADGTLVSEDNEVLRLLQEYLACYSLYDKWIEEQRERVPRFVLDTVVGLLQSYNMNRTQDLILGTAVRRMGWVKDYCLQDLIDKESALIGVDKYFTDMQKKDSESE